MKRAPLRIAVAMFAALPLMAAAADTTQEQAAGLRNDLRAWLTRVVGPDVQVPADLIEVTPEADHFRVAFVLGALPGIHVAEGGKMSAAAYPGQGGKWRIDDLRFASPSKFTVGKPAGAGSAGPMEVTTSFAQTEGKGVLDPSFGTPSTFAMKLHGYEFNAVSPKTQFHSRIDAANGEASLTPTAPGHVDVKQSAVVENYASQQKSGQMPPVDFAAKRMGATLSIGSLDTDRVLPLIHALTRLGKVGSAKGAQGSLDSPQGRKALREVYLAFRGIATGGELNETVEGMRIAGGGHTVGLERLGLGGGVATAGGNLSAKLAIEVGGISSADIPPDARAYLPHRVVMVPSVSGIDLTDLDKLIMAATAPQSEHPDMEARVAALMAHGISVGLDQLAFDLGPAKFSGTGKVTAFAPDKIKGEAEVKATGFDQLMQDAMKSKELAQGVPVLALLRSLARPEGNALIWSVTMENDVVKVNGHDLAGMFGQKKKAAPGSK